MTEKEELTEMLETIKDSMPKDDTYQFNTVLIDIKPASFKYVLGEVIALLSDSSEYARSSNLHKAELERHGLILKVKRLQRYLYGNKSIKLSIEQRNLMLIQEEIMRAYIHVLDLRITHWEENDTNDDERTTEV